VRALVVFNIYPYVFGRLNPAFRARTPHIFHHPRFSAALSRLKTGEMHYKPGQALAVDGISIFSHLNSAIQTYRLPAGALGPGRPANRQPEMAKNGKLHNSRFIFETTVRRRWK